MTPRTLFLISIFFGCFTTNACSQQNAGKLPDVVFAGSTPCDPLIQSMLQISPRGTCDFIRWELIMRESNNARTFTLNIIFGEGQPNTSGFIGGGEKRSFKGSFTILKNKNTKQGGDIYQLKAENGSNAVSLIRLNDNLLHLLTPSGELMVGNGGWSYTLTRKGSFNAFSPAAITSFASVNDTATQVVYDGRTPCQTFANDHHWKVSAACFKLKWRLILNRNPVTHEPTTYTARKVVDNTPRDVPGKWKIIRGIPGNPDAVVYQLDPDKPNESIFFFVGDDNVLFFLNKEFKLYPGNADFSFTLNKKK